MKKLSDYYSNTYSQNGEDGILEKLFDIIGIENKTCIEFGAWDGLHLSTTAKLWKDEDWKSVLIEGDPEKFERLKHNTSQYNVLPICQMVGYTKKDNLDTILTKNKALEEYDLLVIDIDGNDYYVWESIEKTKPRVVVCEYNCSIPPHIDIKQSKDQYFGCSILSLDKLAQTKGYKLVSLTKTNAIFVLKNEYSKFKNFQTELDNLFDKNWLTYVISDYSGYIYYTRRPFWGFRGISTQSILGEYFVPKFNKIPPYPVRKIKRVFTTIKKNILNLKHNHTSSNN